VGPTGTEERIRVVEDNEEATEAWSGVLFDAFVTYRDLVVAGLAQHGEAAMRLHPPQPGDRVLDIGCGFGDTTQQLATVLGPEGEAVGTDVSEPFIEASKAEAAEAGAGNLSFFAADAQQDDLQGPYDYVFSRMGVMFFANPVAAFRNIRGALKPGGRICFVVWRRRQDNDWMYRAQQVADQYLEAPEETDVARCGPGPFSMANADTVSEQLAIAGYEDVTLTRCDLPIKIGDDLDHAVEFNMALGPAAELIRICPPDEVEALRPKLAREIREALTEYAGAEEVTAPASTWIISARVPEAPAA
jgi:SAM-dependent methyltransferase